METVLYIILGMVLAVFTLAVAVALVMLHRSPTRPARSVEPGEEWKPSDYIPPYQWDSDGDKLTDTSPTEAGDS